MASITSVTTYTTTAIITGANGILTPITATITTTITGPRSPSSGTPSPSSSSPSTSSSTQSTIFVTSASPNTPSASNSVLIASLEVFDTSAAQASTSSFSEQNVNSLSASSTSPAVSTSSSNATIAQATSNSLSSGAVGGVAIGCVLAGVAIGAFAAWFFLRRKWKRGAEPHYMPASATARDFSDSKAFSDSAQSSAAPSPAVAAGGSSLLDLEQFLLASVSDKEIGGELQSLGHLIQQHVEDNYHRNPVQIHQNVLTQALADLGLGKDAAMTPGQIASIAVNPNTRYPALQHIIARAVIGSVVLSSTSRFSLLPDSMSAFMQEMAPTERLAGNIDAVSAAFTKWRQLSVFLMHPKRSERTPLVPTESAVGGRAKELVAALNGFLGHFVDSSLRQQQERHLYAVVLECAKFGYLMVSQPGEFRLRYDADHRRQQGGSRDGLVVCPGLDKISDEQGCRHSPPRMILPPAVEIV